MRYGCMNGTGSNGMDKQSFKVSSAGITEFIGVVQCVLFDNPSPSISLFILKLFS